MKDSLFVFDTNTLISAVLLKNSTSRKALNKALTTGALAFSEETMSELSEVLVRSKFDRYITLADRLEFLQRLETFTVIKPTTSKFTECRDTKDNIFLNVAFDLHVKALVSGDQDLLILNPFKSIPIITATEFLGY